MPQRQTPYTMDHRMVICGFGLSSMQGGNEDDLVVALQDVIAFSLQLPICIVYQDEDTRSHCVVFDEKLISLFEQIVFQPMYQVIHIGRLAIGRCRYLDLMRLFFSKREARGLRRTRLEQVWWWSWCRRNLSRARSNR